MLMNGERRAIIVVINVFLFAFSGLPLTYGKRKRKDDTEQVGTACTCMSHTQISLNKLTNLTLKAKVLDTRSFLNNNLC